MRVVMIGMYIISRSGHSQEQVARLKQNKCPPGGATPDGPRSRWKGARSHDPSYRASHSSATLAMTPTKVLTKVHYPSQNREGRPCPGEHIDVPAPVENYDETVPLVEEITHGMPEGLIASPVGYCP